MDASNNKTSYLVSSQLPEFVRRDHPLFIEFIEDYYKFLEQDGGMLYTAKRFPSFYDIDILNADVRHDIEEGHNVEAERYHVLQQQYYNNFIKYVPNSSIADLDVILKHSKDFYRSTGSQKSLRFLTRILFNKEAKTYYPQQNILKASDGKWFVEKSINIRDVAVDNVANSIAYYRFVNTTITGTTSNSTAVIESVNPYYESGRLITELKISQVSNDFINGELLTTTIEDEGVFKTLSANLYSGSLDTVTLTQPGSGYIEGSSVPVESFTGSGAQVIISKVSRGKLEGKIKGVTVNYPGAGYKINDPLLFTGGSGHDANGKISVVDTSEYYHPSYYPIVGSTIDLVANSVIGNAYANLITIQTNTANLLISSGSGTNVVDLTLNDVPANSDVYFETGDVLFIDNTYQTITSSNSLNVNISVLPGVTGNLSYVNFDVLKKANANTVVANAMIFWSYGPCGPMVAGAITNPGADYITLPTVSVSSNTTIRGLGILGRMEIISGGLNYQVGDSIEFTNQYGCYGIGANATVTTVDANGAITRVDFAALSGHATGGMGYRQDMLPYANVVSGTGSGANVQVTSILGEGVSLNAVSNFIGSIAELRVISGGFGYETPPTINLAGQGDGTAQAYANIVTGIYSYPGRYLNQDGQLSSFMFLEDRDYYQPFSYVVQISESLENYRKALKDTIHPAGLKLFGEYLFEDNNETSMNTVNVVNTGISYGVNTSGLIVQLDAAQYDIDVKNNLAYDNLWFNMANTSQYANVSNGAYYSGGSFYFDGINDAITFQRQDSLNVSNLITVVTWINPRTYTSKRENIVATANTGYDRGFHMYHTGSNVNVVLCPPDTNNNLTISNTINTNTWSMVAFTYDGSHVRGYLNGQFTGVTPGISNSATDTSSTIPMSIGYLPGYPVSNNYSGKIAYVQIYNRALSNNEIILNYERYRGRFGI